MMKQSARLTMKDYPIANKESYGKYTFHGSQPSFKMNVVNSPFDKKLQSVRFENDSVNHS